MWFQFRAFLKTKLIGLIQPSCQHSNILVKLLPHLKERYNYNKQNSADHPKPHLDDLGASV